MKKFLALLLAFSIVFLLVGCDILNADEDDDDDDGVFRVTLDYGEGVIKKVKSEDYMLEEPDNIDRDGYVIEYWYYLDEDDEEVIWDFDEDEVEGKMTLYAKWKPVGDDNSGAGSGGNEDDNDDQGGNDPGNDDPSNDTANKSPIPEGGYDGSSVTITFYHTLGMSLRQVLDEYIMEFNKLYPNITIKHSSLGDYDSLRDQLTLDITTGNQPNLAYCYADHVAIYNIAKAVLPLNEFINCEMEITDALGNTSIVGLTEEQLADFIPAFYAEGSAFDDAGTMYTLPMSKSTEVLYYNKTFFESHGLEVPTTWDEMEALCAAIKAIDPDCIPLSYDSEANWFIAMAAQLESGYTSLEDGNHFIFDNEQNREFVERFRSWYQMGYVTTMNLSGSYGSNFFTSNDINCYMVIGSNAGASYYSGSGSEVGIAMIPQIDPDNPKVISQGPSLCMFNSENKQENIATWLFIEFLTTNPEFQAAFSMTSGYVPVIKSASEHPVYQAWIERADGYNYIPALAVKQAISQFDAYFVSPAFNGSSVARTEVGNIIKLAYEYTGGDVTEYIKTLFENAIEACKYYSND